MKLLLDAGADANMQGGEYGTALQAAFEEQEYARICSPDQFPQYAAIIQLLRDHGATDSPKRLQEITVDSDSDIERIMIRDRPHGEKEKEGT